MDSNRLSSEPYFNPQQPGTVCIAIDRYGHYRPSSENALRFLQQGDVETGVRHFLDDNVKAASLCTYVPDVTLLVFRFQSMKDVPPPVSGQTADRYIRDTLLPFLASESRLPEKKIPLADAVYSTLTRGTPDCSVLKKHFMQETGYIEFLGRQRERKNIYRLQPEYVLPLTVVKNDFGYLLFSGNETGREGFRTCIQHVADHYFDPHCDMGRLDIYECPVLEGKLPSFIDTVYAPFRYFPVNRFDFSPHRHVAPSALPEGFTEGLVPLYSHPLRPDADSFAGFISRFKDDERTQTTVSRENYDIYRLLTVMRNGYMNVHEKPFTYFDTLLPVARKLEQVTQVKNAAAFNADDFRIYSSVLSRQAEAILQRDFDVRGHRSIVNELDDGNLAFTVGRVKLNSVQRAVLHDGHAVHLPENDSPENRRQAYCMADRFENRLVTSARPFPGVRTYRMTSDGLIRPVDPEPDGKAKKRETKSKSNKPKI